MIAPSPHSKSSRASRSRLWLLSSLLAMIALSLFPPYLRLRLLFVITLIFQWIENGEEMREQQRQNPSPARLRLQQLKEDQSAVSSANAF
ncbi:MAG: hypothetical protein GVY04_05840 [Cyanobacteria bacterium]|nr:hypothetical protein [Cyanobacteria bacterium GSL.Bin1]